MLSAFLKRLVRRYARNPQPFRERFPQARFLPALESFGDRIVPAVTASFTPSTGILTVFGDSQDNTITISRDAAGKILVNANGTAVAVKGGTATAANTALIQVFGQAGNDTIT